MYLLACGEGSALVLHMNLVLWPVPLNIPLLAPPDMLVHSQGLSSLQPLVCVSTAAPSVVPLWWHLHVPYNKVSPPETPFLADVRPSEQENLQEIICAWEWDQWVKTDESAAAPGWASHHVEASPGQTRLSTFHSSVSPTTIALQSAPLNSDVPQVIKDIRYFITQDIKNSCSLETKLWGK